MEILSKFKVLARENTFRHEFCWISLSHQSAEASSFLKETQKGTNLESRISLQELQMVIKDIEPSLHTFSGLFIKAIVYSANVNISFKSAPSGFTSNLAFLYYSSPSKEWFLYAYGHGRYVHPSLNISREKPSGYYFFVSINEKKLALNKPIPETEISQKS